MMKRVGSYVLQLDFDPTRVHSVRLTVPLLGIEEHVTKVTRFEDIPPGSYDALLTALQQTGVIEKRFKLKVVAGEVNVQKITLERAEKEVLIRPVDAQAQTVLLTEIKIENVDANFRLVRNKDGLACTLSPGEYTIKMILPNMEVRTIPLKVSHDTMVYAIPVDKENSKTRSEPRFRLSVPVLYRRSDGQWVSTKTRNISSAGICLIKGNETLDDKEVFVRLFVPISKVPLECNARVRWTRVEKNAGQQMGLQLLLPDSVKTSLRRWLDLSQRTAPR